jgi:hypothetical protein
MRLREKRGMLLVLFAAILLFATSAASQTIEKGEISGTVLDQSGAVIPDANVKIIQVATGSERALTTGADGSFAANLLSVGGYRMEVSAKGFATTVVKGVHLAVGQNLIQDVTLKLAAVGHTIEVVAETDAIDKAETRENTVIDRTYVEQLPINGRDFREFVNLSPTADTTPGLRSPVRLGGQLGEYTELIIDGVDNRNSFFGEWFGSLETKNFTFPEDAVQEFQVRAGGFSAEFGHSTGGLVNVVTKSGTNEWHGTAHWFFQNLNLVKNTSVPAAPGVVIPPGFNTRHQFGGTLGGPILKDRVFFFIGVDRQKKAGPLGTAFSGQTGCPTPTNPNCVNGVAVPELGIADLAALQGTTPQRQDLLAPLIKLDYRITQNTTATSRFNYSRNETDNFTGGASQIFVFGQVASNFENAVNEGPVASQSVTTVFGPKTVNEARFAYSLERRDRLNRGPGPETAITGVGNFGQRFFLPITSRHKRYQVLDNFSRTFGKHDVRLGVDLNANATAQVFIGDSAGVYNFSSLSDFQNRIPSQFTQLFGINGLTAVQSGTLPYFWQKELAFYLQDNWRILPRVTLNLGIRWDGVWNPQPHFTLPGDRVDLGRPHISGTTLTQRVGPVPQSIPNDLNDVGPRVGVAWDVTGNSKTIVRGGVGIYYAALPTIFMASILSGPGVRGSTLSIPQCSATRTTVCFNPATGVATIGTLALKYPDRLPTTLPPALAPFLPSPNISFADPDFQSARVLNLQAGVEREIAKNFTISGTYSYNRSENLRTGGFSLTTPFDRTIDPTGVTFDTFGRSIGPGNTLAFAIPRLPQSINPVNGLPAISGASALTSYGRARYHAFILQAKKTFSHNYQFGANYTVSKNDDNATSDRDTDAFLAPSDPFNFLKLDYGRSQLDIRHTFTAYAYILLPLKIEFGTFISARSGRAYPAYGGFCPGPGSGYQDGFQCVDFFISAVRPAANGKLLPRYPFRNSDFAQWDVRLGREFPIYERLRLRFTAEAFNLTNRENAFSLTTGVSTNGVCFNLPTSCFAPGKGPAILDGPSPRGPLAGQFGLKFIF